MLGRLLSLAALGTILVPGTALGATVGVAGEQISFDAAAGESNALTIARDGTEYVFTEAAAVTITPAAPCVSAGANIARCPMIAVFRIDADLGNLDDSATVAASVTAPQLDGLTIRGELGSDMITGGPNVANSLLGDSGITAGNDVLTGGGLDDSLFGGDGNDVLTGLGGDDSLRPGDGDDVVDGGPGRDSVGFDAEGPDGADTVIGGTGSSDSLDLRDRLDGIRVDLNGLPDDGAAGEGDDFKPDIERVDSGDGNDLLLGGPGRQVLQAGAGNDTVDGGDGDDLVNGSDGDDAVAGGAGDDELNGSSGADSIDGGGGYDYVNGFELFDDGSDLIAGGGGVDEIGGGELAFALRVDLDGEADDGVTDPLSESPLDNVLANLEGVEGGSADDVLIGNKRDNTFEGGAGDDRIVGGGGADGLAGGRGDDGINGGKDRDSIEGEAGADRIKSRDGGPDEVSCGSARDVVKADRADRAGADCDRVKRSGGGK